MARAASATARGIFSWGAPRRRGLWRPWQGEEKHLQLAQLQQDGGHRAGKVQAVLLPIHQPPAAGEALHLSYVFFSDTNLLSVVWFGSRSRSCSETSWSLDLTGPFGVGVIALKPLGSCRNCVQSAAPHSVVTRTYLPSNYTDLITSY